MSEEWGRRVRYKVDEEGRGVTKEGICGRW
jgi:hypothetical protein